MYKFCGVNRASISQQPNSSSAQVRMQDPSHHAELGLHPREFSPELLKKQYRALALRWHPDRNRGSEEAAAEKFKEIQGAPLLGACRLWPTGATRLCPLSCGHYTFVPPVICAQRPFRCSPIPLNARSTISSSRNGARGLHRDVMCARVRPCHKLCVKYGTNSCVGGPAAVARAAAARFAAARRERLTIRCPGGRSHRRSDDGACARSCGESPLSSFSA